MDYQANSNKSKEPERVPEKPKVEKVVVGEVITKKKSLGRKFKDVFISVDMRSVIDYIISDVLIPAARNTIVDASTKGVERMMYGENAVRRRNLGSGSRVIYNSPVQRSMSDPRGRQMPRTSIVQPTARVSQSSDRHNQDDFILSSREEADLVIERLSDMIDTYGVASVADLNELVGFPTTPTDNKWGWEYLVGAKVRQIREGYLIDFPPATPI